MKAKTAITILTTIAIPIIDLVLKNKKTNNIAKNKKWNYIIKQKGSDSMFGDGFGGSL